jgi:hypothetical protein
MSWPRINARARTQPVAPDHHRTRYVVVRQEDVWFIHFAGEEFGPYKTEREAMLFAIDAAHQLSEQGEETQVLVVDENGEARPAWTYRQDPYPPRL